MKGGTTCNGGSRKVMMRRGDGLISRQFLGGDGSESEALFVDDVCLLLELAVDDNTTEARWDEEGTMD